MLKTITQRSTPLTGSYRPEGDKSLSHRALLFASLAEGTSTIRRFLIGGVTKAMLRCLRALGVEWSLDEASHTLTVHGVGLKGFKTPNAPLDCGNSATTFRLLAGAIAGAGIECILDGSEGLRKRPMDRIVEPLRMLGAKVNSEFGIRNSELSSRRGEAAVSNGSTTSVVASTNKTFSSLDGASPDASRNSEFRIPNSEFTTAPLAFEPGEIGSLNYVLPVASAQVKSCLILAALSGNAPSAFLEPGPSRDHTERMLAAMGARVKNLSAGYGAVVLPQETPLKPLNIELAGDISSAAFMMVAATILPGSDFVLQGVGVNPTRTGIIDALRAMGADITLENECEMAGEPVADIRVRSAQLHGTSVAGDLVVRMIDEFPAFMIAAACATGETIVRDAAELRTKESDRIAMMTSELRALGVEMEEYPDGFRICGTGTITGGATVCAHGDHRIAMSLALAALVAETPVTIDGFEMLNESFPDFPRVLGL